MLQDEVIDPGNEPSKAAAKQLELPVAPDTERASVKAWEEPVTMLTYAPAAPDKNPLFLEKRVYQGSSGRVYPLPVIDCIETEGRAQSWQAVHLENEFVRLMILPEVGGRIHVGLDKRTGYDFFYRQNVMKPALVGLAGPWASGGVEFNWPQHHRPATFMPVEVSIERDEDGSVTIWCSDHDPMARMKGMHGICLHPGKAFVEVRVRLYNRTQDTQTFLWWANVATRVHECYQSFFPKDVRYAADHAKRALTEYPLSHSTYYGVPYGEREQNGVPEEQKPSQFIPDGSYAVNDLGWYANIPVPTSYMIVGSRGDFFGGYDHKKMAGTVAVANHHVSPGKKQWTWGNHEFGYAWDRNLTDSDGPYIELMSGVYTDNQPDFSFLAPGETKTFSQYWYPISDIGIPDIANLDAAMRLERVDGEARVHLQVTASRPRSTVLLRLDGREIGRWIGDLDTDHPFHQTFSGLGTEGVLEVTVEQDDALIIRYAPEEIVPTDAPAVATEPPLPEDVVSNDELFLSGLHLEQYRHPTRSPETYWLEAVRRDPGDSRCTHALGRWHLRRGQFELAEQYLRASISRLTSRNPNPYDGEPYYNLGRTLLYQERTSEAYDAFYKSTWNAAWRSPAYLRLAEIDCVRKDWKTALDHLNRSLRAESDDLNARNLKALVLRKLGRHKEAEDLLAETQLLDPLDIFSRFLVTNEVPKDGQLRLDLGFDLLHAGFLREALEVFSGGETQAKDGSAAMLLYAEADVLLRLGSHQDSAEVYGEAMLASSDYVFPSRLEELVVLRKAIERNPDDAMAPYYLGNLLYDRRRHREAVELWERTTQLNPKFPIAWRNLGFAYFNALHDSVRAIAAFARARERAPEDARVLFEQDQLLKRTGEAPEKRLAVLEASRELVDRRDDLSVEVASLYNSLGSPEQALMTLQSRHFQPWEGGEGLVLTEYVRANVLLALGFLAEDRPHEALPYLLAAWDPPPTLNEAKHLLMNLSMIDYWLGVTYQKLGTQHRAEEHWNCAARQRGDFQQMQVQTISEMTYWSALALRELGREEEAVALAEQILQYAEMLKSEQPTIDYFATSLPAMLLFEEDLKTRQDTYALFLEAQACLVLGDPKTARRLLKQVQHLDRNHAGANDLLRSLERDACKVH